MPEWSAKETYRANWRQPRKISIMQTIPQFRLVPTIALTKSELKVRVGAGTVEGRGWNRYFDGKRIEKINKAGRLRTNSTGFNTCSEERRSEIRIACTVRNKNRDVSMIVPTKKGIKGNGIITTSHFMLFDWTIVSIKIGGKSVLKAITII